MAMADMGQRLVDFVVGAQSQEMNGVLFRAGIINELEQNTVVEINGACPRTCQATLQLVAVQ